MRLFQLLVKNKHEFNEYHSIYKYIKPCNKILNKKGTNIGDLSFKEVVFFRKSLSSSNVNNFLVIFAKIYRIRKWRLLFLKLKNFYPAFNFIIKEFETLQERESNMFSTSMDNDFKNAGGKRLNVFAELNSLISIGEQFKVPPQTVECWSYNLVTTLLYRQQVMNEVTERYHNIINKK